MFYVLDLSLNQNGRKLILMEESMTERRQMTPSSLKEQERRSHDAVITLVIITEISNAIRGVGWWWSLIKMRRYE